jgi:hypothetical protein
VVASYRLALRSSHEASATRLALGAIASGQDAWRVPRRERGPLIFATGVVSLSRERPDGRGDGRGFRRGALIDSRDGQFG